MQCLGHAMKRSEETTPEKQSRNENRMGRDFEADQGKGD